MLKSREFKVNQTIKQFKQSGTVPQFPFPDFQL